MADRMFFNCLRTEERCTCEKVGREDLCPEKSVSPLKIYYGTIIDKAENHFEKGSSVWGLGK